MSVWRTVVTRRIRAFAASDEVYFTQKADAEIRGLALALGRLDAIDLMSRLTAEEAAERIRSSTTGEWLYVYRTRLAGVPLYVKVVLRNACVVVSFHEDEEADGDEADETA